MKIIIDVNYCPECEKLECEFTANTPVFDYMESFICLDSYSKLEDVLSLVIDHYTYDLKFEYCNDISDDDLERSEL